jgi:hypothetical protein
MSRRAPNRQFYFVHLHRFFIVHFYMAHTPDAHMFCSPEEHSELDAYERSKVSRPGLLPSNFGKANLSHSSTIL